MKTPALLTAICLVSSLPLGAQSILLQDNFNSYTPGVLAPSANWPSSIPGTDPALTWATNNYNRGPQQILANAGGRSGNVFSYSENITGGTSRTYSSVALSSAYSGTDDWVLSLDFYVENMPVGINGGNFGLVALSNGNVETSSTILTLVGIQRNQSNVNLRPNVSRSVDGIAGSTFGDILTLDTWYTLTLTGNNATQTFGISVVGPDYNWSVPNLTYLNSHNQFNNISIGDAVASTVATGHNNQAYLDNFSLVTVPVPEPGSIALLLLGAGLVGLVSRRKKA